MNYYNKIIKLLYLKIKIIWFKKINRLNVIPELSLFYVFSGMVSKQLINTEPYSLFNLAYGRHFVQNMSISHSCSNHAIYLKWYANPLTRHSKSWLSHTCFACESSVRFPIPINPDHLSIFALNASYPEYLERTTTKFRHHQRYILSRHVNDIRWLQEHSVDYMNLRRDLSVSLLPAILILSNGCEKIFNVVPSASCMCTRLIERISFRITTTRFRLPPPPFRTNLNSDSRIKLILLL